jgi:subtilisin family serine protease
MAQDPIRYYVVLKGSPTDLQPYFDQDSAKADEWARDFVVQQVFGRPMADPPLRVRARPSNEIFSGSERSLTADRPQEVVVALDILGSDKQSSSAVVNEIISAVAAKPAIFAGSSPDLPFTAADHWCIGDASDPIFSDRSGAEKLLGVPYLRGQADTTGRGVNVVIVDQGLDRQALGSSYGGGWSVGTAHPGSPLPQPGSVRRPHGMMIAHNILKVAPEAKLFDLPLAPPDKISNIQAFLSFADAAYLQMLMDIDLWKLGSFPGPWILVNPWGIFDRKSEHPLGHYTENPHNHFNQLVVNAVQRDIDVVFAAGNCGQFCPDNRCGEEDRGPSRSIWGANSLEAVVTVGAVRADNMWLGYSSQGPGQPRLGADKPDLCATSQFCEDDDAFSINTGTSAACGLTAGVVAALRSRWNAATVSPHQLKQILNQTARKPTNVPWSTVLAHRLGHGVLNATAAFDQLKHQFP